MLAVKPFSAVRYDFERTSGDLSALIAPPYDVLNQADKDVLLQRDPRNIVAVDLPHVPPKSAGPTEVYERSAHLLEQWLADGTLIREQRPALYLYHQRFPHDGTMHTRRMFVARVRLQSFSGGSILPHERTFGGPKEDRLALMKATRFQLSPILGLYTDPEDRIGTAFAGTASKPPHARATLDEVDNRLWIVTDAAVVDAVASAMTEKRIFIADGHHRYGTAMMYRDGIAKEAGGTLPHDHPANDIMFVLASMDDPGCLILPYHRVLAHVSLTTVLSAWSAGTAPCDRTEADVVLFDPDTGDERPLRFTARNKLAALEPGECDAWYALDYAYLHRYLLDELMAEETGGKVDVRYVKSGDEARRTARDLRGVALLMNATPMSHLRAVSEAGGLMPQKSTYFHPKLATGLTLYALA